MPTSNGVALSSCTTSTGMATAVTAVPNELIDAAAQYRPNEPRGGGASAGCALTTVVSESRRPRCAAEPLPPLDDACVRSTVGRLEHRAPLDEHALHARLDRERVARPHDDIAV